ncbi:MAG: membrane or secreted protein [Chitinophagales bacterium]
MMRTFFRLLALLIVCILTNELKSQKPESNNLVYVDKQGVLRWTKNHTEASFFGVNYTAPFAYSYRAHKALGIDIEKAIQQDVYELARLGLDAFRVHVWDTEISDTLGNLLENDHLKLFDFLLAELEKRNIKAIITPIAFWGNGYPERDEATPGFSRKYGKGNATSNEAAIQAQENYLRQFFTHVNPYTKLTYVGDANIIAVELNNEPSHSGSKAGVTNYINRLAATMKSVGWTKPLYYNIAQSPFYADAVAKAKIDGVGFQWYPTGLVANQEVKGNFLPNVDHYKIPYDTIPEYRTKSKMVYEFDAADVLQSCMYPAIARSFREAGFQWATQFAYDPTALAYANTEYQTHYLNLFYTPSKAISLLIASKVFHKIPRLKTYGSYPADSVFDVFRVSYKNSLSEMNSDEEFYYSNSTNTKPVTISKLKHIAGVGSSPIVKYEGTGAYFLDKISDGVWRLEVMPDAIYIHDPFERASPKKEVTRIEWKLNEMHVLLPELDSVFLIGGLTEGGEAVCINGASADCSGGFYVYPGVYLIEKLPVHFDYIKVENFFAPQPFSTEPFVSHIPYSEVSANRSFTIQAKIVGIDSNDKATVQINRFGGGFGQSKMIAMTKKTSYDYLVEVPAELVVPGELNYRIIIQKANAGYFVFPGNYKGDPFAWDNYNNDTWQTFVAAENSTLEIFDPTHDRNVRIYPPFKRGFQTNYITATEPGQLILKLSANGSSDDPTIGFQFYFADKLKGRESEAFDKLIIKARTAETQPLKAKITLTNKDAFSFSANITLTANFQNIEVPLNDFVPDSELLLPRPYPGFLPLWFTASGMSLFKLSDMEKIQVTIGTDAPSSEFKRPYSLEVESIWLEKRK